jgi:hypothetical protein
MDLISFVIVALTPNQAMQLTAGRSVTNFWDDFYTQPAASSLSASGS